MPIINKIVCKEILDDNGNLSGAAASLVATTAAVGTNILHDTVAETNKGAEWVAAAQKFTKKAARIVNELHKEAAELCRTQPVGD